MHLLLYGVEIIKLVLKRRLKRFVQTNSQQTHTDSW